MIMFGVDDGRGCLREQEQDTLRTEQTHEHTDGDHRLTVQLAPRPAAGVGDVDVVADCAQHSELGGSSHRVCVWL